jgi:hypothetical protein
MLEDVTCSKCGIDCKDIPSGTPCPRCGNTQRNYTYRGSLDFRGASSLRLRGGESAMILNVDRSVSTTDGFETMNIGGNVQIRVPLGILTREQRLEVGLRALGIAALTCATTAILRYRSTRRTGWP